MPKRTPRSRAARTPMGAKTHATPRAVRGRTDTATTPVVIRGAVDRDGTATAASIQLRLGQKLGKYSWRIDRLDVALSSKTPAKGSAEAEITITARMPGMGAVAAVASAADVRSAFQGALRAVERLLGKTIDKRRRKPVVAAQKASARSM